MKNALTQSAFLLFAASTLAPHAAAQLSNNGFDSGVVAAGGNGHVPSPWTSTAPGVTTIAFDTFDHSGANGLAPGTAALFPGITAQSGTRWAGGWDFENMSQLMSFTLTPGQQYTVDAWVHAPNSNIFIAGGWRFGLGASVAATPTIVAVFPMTVTWANGWVYQSATFTAPSNAASLPYFFPQVYAPVGANSYMAIDDVRLSPVPAPGSFALCGLGAALCIRRRRVT